MKGVEITYKKMVEGYAGGVNCDAVILDTIITYKDCAGAYLALTAYLIKDIQEDVCIIFPEEIIKIK